MSRRLGKTESFILLTGDLVLLYAALFCALTLRYFTVPTWQQWKLHLLPFSIIFAVWILVFFIAGLYERHTLLFIRKLPARIFSSLVANGIIAMIFFYLAPDIAIAPKTVLVIFIAIAFVFIIWWRLYGRNRLGWRKKQKVLLVGEGDESEELARELNSNPGYGFSVQTLEELTAGTPEQLCENAESGKVRIAIVDKNSAVARSIQPHLYELLRSGVAVIDFVRLYEELFHRVPLSRINYQWFFDNISLSAHPLYDHLKRVMDITAALAFGILSLPWYPIVTAAIKLEDGGPIFIRQERIGKDNKKITIYKFRSMARNELDPTQQTDNVVTRTGAFLRKTRVDELPQLWNVLKGDLSLIGPRPELPAAVLHYTEEIPYYNIRHLIKPGLSGWAQIYHEAHPHHTADTHETKNKLSYDLYYIKHRSFFLDVEIALKTVATLLAKTGL